MEYKLLTDKTAIDFLNYYETRLENFGTHVPMASIWESLNGKLALKCDHYECLHDTDHNEILRFTYKVLCYVIIFDVWDYKFGKIDKQKVCLVNDGSISATLTKQAAKEWKKWFWRDIIQLPIIAICTIVTVIIAVSLLIALRHNLAWYITLMAFLLLSLYAIIPLSFCFKYWHEHHYLKLWLKTLNYS